MNGIREKCGRAPAPADPLEDVFDPTGAGDTFGGGFVGYLASVERPDEDALRRANSYNNREPRVRQNLALVVGLQGRFDEAQQIAQADLAASIASPDEST